VGLTAASQKDRMDCKELAKIAKALSDPTRLQIYGAIAGCEEMFCGELVEKYALTPGTISHHLKILGEASLIESRREGQFIYNRLRPETIKDYAQALAKMAGISRKQWILSDKYSADSGKV
jgi:ArsR family transcriptional regulator, arsenate/arsenite/antimonite-responsive transcriptional repressor